MDKITVLKDGPVTALDRRVRLHRALDAVLDERAAKAKDALPPLADNADELERKGICPSKGCGAKVSPASIWRRCAKCRKGYKGTAVLGAKDARAARAAKTAVVLDEYKYAEPPKKSKPIVTFLDRYRQQEEARKAAAKAAAKDAAKNAALKRYSDDPAWDASVRFALGKGASLAAAEKFADLYGSKGGSKSLETAWRAVNAGAKGKDAGGRWVTAHGTHIEINGKGEVEKGPAALKGAKKPSSAKAPQSEPTDTASARVALRKLNNDFQKATGKESDLEDKYNSMSRDERDRLGIEEKWEAAQEKVADLERRIGAITKKFPDSEDVLW